MIDDERLVRLVVPDLLRNREHEAESAIDGDEATLFYKKQGEIGQPFDDGILNINIAEGIDDRETIKRLRELDPDIRAIALNGNHGDPVMIHHREYGFRAVLPKPYGMGELNVALSKQQQYCCI